MLVSSQNIKSERMLRLGDMGFSIICFERDIKLIRSEKGTLFMFYRIHIRLLWYNKESLTITFPSDCSETVRDELGNSFFKKVIAFD